MNSKHILITGASGLIGTHLTAHLLKKGYYVSHVGRTHREGKIRSYSWNVEEGYIEEGVLQDVEAIIHLAGANVGDKPWNERRKQEIRDSRIKSTALLFDRLGPEKSSIKTFITASGVGYYGTSPEKVFTESDPAGEDFLANVTQQWEREADTIKSLGIRVVKIRTGVVLSRKGGALAAFIKPVKWYVGAPLGSGEQNISWIHIDDLCNMYLHALEDERLDGAYNATAPHPVTNREMMYAAAKALGKKIILPPIPGFVLTLLLGEMAYLVLEGSKISSDKIRRTGFEFQYDTLEKAFKDIFKPA